MKKTKKATAVILSAALALSAATAMSAGASAEWVETDEGFCYIDNSIGKRLTGWQTIGSDEYYFDGKWHAVGKRQYYFDKNGIALTGWQEIDGSTYFFNGEEKGRLVTSWINSAKGRYYFGKDGAMRRGWKLIGDDIYFFGSNGIMRAGEQTIGDNVYTFDGEGRLIDPAPEKITLNHVLQGISFGMTKEEVWQNAFIDLNKNSEELAFNAFISGDKGHMRFDDDGHLEEIDLQYPSSGVKELFENSGWIYKDKYLVEYPHTVDYAEHYLSEDGSAGAIVYYYWNNDRTKTQIMICSCDEAEFTWKRHTA